MRKTVAFDPEDVLRVLRESGEKGKVWSSIAAALLGVPRDEVKIEHVRGVRDATRELVEAGLAVEYRRLRFRAVVT